MRCECERRAAVLKIRPLVAYDPRRRSRERGSGRHEASGRRSQLGRVSVRRGQRVRRAVAVGVARLEVVVVRRAHAELREHAARAAAAPQREPDGADARQQQQNGKSARALGWYTILPAIDANVTNVAPRAAGPTFGKADGGAAIGGAGAELECVEEARVAGERASGSIAQRNPPTISESRSTRGATLRLLLAENCINDLSFGATCRPLLPRPPSAPPPSPAASATAFIGVDASPRADRSGSRRRCAPRPTSAADPRARGRFSAPLHQQRPRQICHHAEDRRRRDAAAADFSTRDICRRWPRRAAGRRRRRWCASTGPTRRRLSRPTRPASAAALRSTTASSASLLARPASAAALLGRRPAPRPSAAPPPHSLLAARRALGGGWQLAATIAEADEMEDDLKASLPALRAALSRGVAYAPRPRRRAGRRRRRRRGRLAAAAEHLRHVCDGTAGRRRTLLPWSMLPRSRAAPPQTPPPRPTLAPRRHGTSRARRWTPCRSRARLARSAHPRRRSRRAARAAAAAPAPAAPRPRPRPPAAPSSSEAAAVARRVPTDERRAAAVAGSCAAAHHHGPARPLTEPSSGELRPHRCRRPRRPRDPIDLAAAVARLRPRRPTPRPPSRRRRRRCRRARRRSRLRHSLSDSSKP